MFKDIIKDSRVEAEIDNKDELDVINRNLIIITILIFIAGFCFGAAIV